MKGTMNDESNKPAAAYRIVVCTLYGNRIQNYSQILRYGQAGGDRTPILNTQLLTAVA